MIFLKGAWVLVIPDKSVHSCWELSGKHDRISVREKIEIFVRTHTGLEA